MNPQHLEPQMDAFLPIVVSVLILVLMFGIWITFAARISSSRQMAETEDDIRHREFERRFDRDEDRNDDGFGAPKSKRPASEAITEGEPTPGSAAPPAEEGIKRGFMSRL